MKTRMLIGLVVLIVIIACNSHDDDSIVCDQVTLVSSEQYETAPDDELFINSLKLNGDCLKINFTAGGCTGDTWDLLLIDSGVILESIPPQRTLRLSLRDEEDCEVLVTRDLTFDVNELKVEGDQVLLNITNSDDQILYEY